MKIRIGTGKSGNIFLKRFQAGLGKKGLENGGAYGEAELGNEILPKFFYILIFHFFQEKRELSLRARQRGQREQEADPKKV